MYATTAILSFLGVVIGVMYKSKCSEVSVCFGALQFQRNVDIELREDEQQRSAAEHPENNV